MAAHREFMQAKYHELLQVNKISALACLLQTSQVELYRLRFEKPYSLFEVKKNAGKSRLIESPQMELKKALHQLNGYLQCAYFFNRTKSAYGFVQQPRNAANKRNIVTNARRHCGKPYLLCIDLEDFFHQVSRLKVIKIFTQPPFRFPFELSNFLSELVTYKNRLPMGSPTSPSLSNFATIDLDIALETLCAEQKITYTRYVDDLSFSSNNSIGSDFFYNIQELLARHGFRMNTNKIKWMGTQDEKMVTGLVLAEKPEPPTSFLEDLDKNIKRLKHVLEFSAVSHQSASPEWIYKFRQHLLGKLRFLQMVYGYQHETYKKMNRLYIDAFNTQPFVESFNWNSFPYY